MIRDDQFIGQLEDYLDGFEGATPLPDRVRDAVHAALPSVRQVRPSPAPLRRLTSAGDRSIAAGWALIAAALIVAIGAGTILNFDRLFGTAATPSPTVSPTPGASGSSNPLDAAVPPGTLLNDAQYRSCGRGGPPISCINPGRYTLGNGLLGTTVTIDVPTGWFEWDMGTGTQGVLLDRPDVKDGTGWGVLFSAVGLVSRNPCDAKKGTFPVGSTSSVDGLVAAMTSWPDFEVSAPRPITLGGASGKQIAITYVKTSADCPVAVIWKTPQGTAIDGYPMVAERPKGYTAQFRILDVGGEILAVRTSDFPQTSPFEVSQGLPPDPGRHRADQQTLHEILDSIRFGQTP
jgi:hypothetical protein